MDLIGPLNLVYLGIRILLLNLTKCLKATGINAAKLNAPELKLGLRLADLIDDCFSLVFREIKRVIDLNSLSLKVLAVSGNEQPFVGSNCLDCSAQCCNMCISEWVKTSKKYANFHSCICPFC